MRLNLPRSHRGALWLPHSLRRTPWSRASWEPTFKNTALSFFASGSAAPAMVFQRIHTEDFMCECGDFGVVGRRVRQSAAE